MATPNMNLTLPIVNVTPGPQYANQEVSCFTLIDEHDHTANKGVAIPTNGLNINGNLPMNNFGLTDTSRVTFTSQLSTPTNQSVYVSGVDLYYVDGGGNNVRITQSGSVTGATGTITGLPSTPPKSASAAFVDADNSFKFQSDSNIAAIIDCRDLWLRNSTASSYKMVVSVPSLGADTSIVLPARPGSTNILTMDSTGNMVANYIVDNSTIEVSSNTLQVKTITASNIANATITQTQMANNSIGTSQIINANVTRAKLAAVGEQISSNSGTFTTTNAVATDVTNLTVTITTTGRPVMLMLLGGTLRITGTSGTEWATVGLIRDVVNTVTSYTFGLNDIRVPASSVNAVDVIAAGTYTYKVTLQTILSCPASVISARLLAYEL
jgi:hypothetical protein